MFYVYMDGFYGTELIGTANDLAGAEKIKAEQDAKLAPGYLWSTRICRIEEKEVSYYD